MLTNTTLQVALFCTIIQSNAGQMRHAEPSSFDDHSVLVNDFGHSLTG